MPINVIGKCALIILLFICALMFAACGNDGSSEITEGDSMRQALGLHKVKANNVEKIRLVQNRETSRILETADTELITGLLDYFDSIGAEESDESWVGEYMFIDFYTKRSLFNKSERYRVVIFIETNYARSRPGEDFNTLAVVGKAKTEEEWEEFLELCERVH